MSKEKEFVKEITNIEDDFAQWYMMIDDASYTLLLAQKGAAGGWRAESAETRKVMDIWEFSDDSQDNIRVVCDSEVVFSNAEGKEKIYEGSIERPLWQLIWSYTIDNTDGKASITVTGEEYSREEEGVNIVVLDHGTGRVADSVTVQISEDGLTLVR